MMKITGPSYLLNLNCYSKGVGCFSFHKQKYQTFRFLSNSPLTELYLLPIPDMKNR